MEEDTQMLTSGLQINTRNTAYTCMCSLLCTCVCSQTQRCTPTQTWTHSYTTHTCMYTHTHIRMYTRKHAHICTSIFKAHFANLLPKNNQIFFYVPTGVEQSLISALAFGIYFAAHLFLKPNSTFHKEGRKASEAVVSHGFDLSPNCICGFLQLSLHVKINLYHMPSPGEY